MTVPFGMRNNPGWDALRVQSLNRLGGLLSDNQTPGMGLTNSIYVWHADGSDIGIYDPDEAGLIDAIAASVSGDTIWMPSITIALTTSLTLKAGVMLRGISGNAAISITANDASNHSTLIGPASGTAYILLLTVLCTNSGSGNAVALDGGAGQVYAQDSYFNGQSTGGAGYGVRSAAGTITLDDCWVLGSTAPQISTGGATTYTRGSSISSASITVNSAAGQTIGGLTVGNWYAIETTGDGYQTNPSAHPNQYLTHVQISNNGGVSWSIQGGFGATSNDSKATWVFDLTSTPAWVPFVETIDDRHIRFFWQATATSIMIRASDEANWEDNTGSLGWHLYNATVTLGGGGIITHAVRLNPVSGDPAQGDRSVWDALNYQTRHANDIDIAAGIHHTLGTGSGQAAPGNHTHTGSGSDTSGHALANFSIDGRLATAANVGGAFVCAFAASLVTVFIFSPTPGTAGSTILDVNLNGTSIFTDPADRPTLAYNASNGVSYAVPSAINASEFDVITFDLDQVATGVEGLSIVLDFGAATPTGSPIPNYSMDAYKIGANTDNVALPLGAGGAWDDTYITQPWIVEQGGTLYLFYGGFDGANTRIGVATASVSGFTGVNFSKYGSNPILDLGAGGAWDNTHVAQPTVIYDAEAALWKMWYVGNNSGVEKVGYATASNPLGPWTKYGSNPIISPAGWEGSIIAGMSVIKESSTSYKMLYHGNDVTTTNGAIGLATSSDGISWTKYASNPVLLRDVGQAWRAKSVFCPRTLIKQSGTYYLYFNGKPTSAPDFSKIGYATSSDLITWTVQDSPLILSATRTWEGITQPPGEVEEPFGIQIGSNFYLYYFAWYGTTDRTIGVSVVPL